MKTNFARISMIVSSLFIIWNGFLLLATMLAIGMSGGTDSSVPFWVLVSIIVGIILLVVTFKTRKNLVALFLLIVTVVPTIVVIGMSYKGRSDYQASQQAQEVWFQQHCKDAGKNPLLPGYHIFNCDDGTSFSR